MKSILISTIGLLFSLVAPTYGASLKGQYISHSFLANNTFYFDYAKMQDLVVFGDDLSSTNTNYKNMKYDSKINGGKNWALKLADIPDHKVWLWNYAHNGAVVDFNLVGRDESDTSFLTQCDKFTETLYGKDALRNWASRTTLFAIWFGTNDLIYMNRPEGVSSTEVIDNIISTKFQKMQDLYDHGARHFLIIYVPAIEKSPLNKSNALSFGESDATYYNAKINDYSSNFSSTHPDTNILIYDADMEFKYIMENKGEFGIENITDSCEDTSSDCDNKDSTFFWSNNIQPSVRVQEALAQDIHEFLTSRQVTVIDEQYATESSASSINYRTFLFWNAIIVLLSFFLF
ncbi:hypothetical protein BCR36DRAFT_330000 [Piromyces finnis]|uniref:Carbohydrate esterase family 16 protein n=1 Tax=Piromyces finnis TaxID=1754191 RepID=A0A1Y1V5M8_9FUNG|nr:hypothetical protein BCR36DRAFT_330000 [Piromyces finnis]|eukprot:ORX47856.1 hypothetical protein BCR36DRAFT_330000 [Piromyces finnis]